MKLWKVSTHKIISEKELEIILNSMERDKKNIKEIVYNSHYNEYEIIYTIEDGVEE